MNILKEVLKHEVFPALGCTEPIAVAFGASCAAKEIKSLEFKKIIIKVDPGVYKNGLAVTVPNTNGERGNLIAGVLGALIQKPSDKMEILKNVTPHHIAQAKQLIQSKRAQIECDHHKQKLSIDVYLETSTSNARSLIENSHLNLVRLEKNGEIICNSVSKMRKKYG